MRNIIGAKWPERRKYSACLKSNEKDSELGILIRSITTRNVPERIVRKWFLINSREQLGFLESNMNSQEQETLR